MVGVTHVLGTPLLVHIVNAPDIWAITGSIAALVTALATTILAIGIVIAALQLRLNRKFSKIAESDQLLREFDDGKLREACARLEVFDGVETYLESSRSRANKIYARVGW